MYANSAARRLAGLVVVLATLAVAAPAVAQEDELKPPAGWQVRTDGGGHGGGDDMYFAEMPPGFHITTGPSAIFYDPGKTASGSYRLESEIFLFDPGGRNEGFGVIFGARNLDSDDQAYSYFLIRRDGSCLIKRRDGGETTTVRGWDQQDAVLTWEQKADDDATVRNALVVEVSDSDVKFFVNDVEVATVPRSELHTDGIVGLRANHSVNLHVTGLEITE